MALKDNQTSITFHNGVLTIGGTIIEVAYGGSHIFFDFGSVFDPSSPVQPTELQGLLDTGMLPWLNHVYDPATPLDGYAEQEDTFHHTAVFLSHVHLDHTKAVNFIDPEIPVYALNGTCSLLRTLNIHNDFLFPRSGPHTENTRKLIGVDEYGEVAIGPIRVKLLPVDHDAYGACGLLIRTPGAVIAYTGDIRMHGYRKAQTLSFCREAKNCDLLISEGVSISFQEVGAEGKPPGIETEEVLIELILDAVKQYDHKQITFNYYVSNIERILNLIHSVKRTVVLEAYYAYTIKEASGMEVWYYQLDDKEYGLDPAKKIDFAELIDDESRFFWQLSSPALAYMGKLKKGGLYIHTNAQPLGPFEPSYEPFMQAFEDCGIDVKVMGCSGHAYVDDLVKLVDTIAPKLLTPIHSLHPERLCNKSGDRLLPEKKQTIYL